MNILIQFLVPLAIMAMWALTSLLNREAQPLPTRGPAPNPGPGRANGPGGGRGEPVNASRFQPPASSVADRTQSQRWPEVTPQARPGALRVGATDDGIMIIGSDNRGNRRSRRPDLHRLPRRARNIRGAQPRRGSRVRPASITGPPKPKEADHQRALTSLVNQSLAQKKNRPLEITPLSSPLSPINAPLTQVSMGTAIEHPGSYQLHTALTSTELRAMFATSNKLREIALLNELLQPPLSLRAPRHRR